jgi:hypothetical protein
MVRTKEQRFAEIELLLENLELEGNEKKARIKKNIKPTKEENQKITSHFNSLDLYDLNLPQFVYGYGDKSEIMYIMDSWISFQIRKLGIYVYRLHYLDDETQDAMTNFSKKYEEDNNPNGTLKDHLKILLYLYEFDMLEKKYRQKNKKISTIQLIKDEEAAIKRIEKGNEIIDILDTIENQNVYNIILPCYKVHMKKGKLMISGDTTSIRLTKKMAKKRPSLLNDLVTLASNEFITNLQENADFCVIPFYQIDENSADKFIDIHFDLSGSETLNIRYSYKDGYQRLNGDTIYTAEVLSFEMNELTQRYRDQRIIAVAEKTKERKVKERNAYQMFLSTLSESQQRMLEKTDLVLLEGEKYYYFATSQITNGYLCRFKKNNKLEGEYDFEKFESLCIHPEYTIPLFDGLATIQLHLMSGEEEYITKNSNIFRFSSGIRNQIKEFMNELKEKNMNFDGMKTVEAIY